MWLQQRVANGDLIVQKVDGVSNLADALTKHLGKSALVGHMESVRFEIRDGRHVLMPVCESADNTDVGATVCVEDDEHLMQVALANCFVCLKGLEPEHGSITTRLFDVSKST